MGRIRKAYSAKEKLTIIKYAEEHGNRCAGRQFDVSEASVREWRRKKSQLETMPKKEEEDDDHSYYTVANNGMTDEAIQKLFDESDEEEFDGFDPVRE